MISLANAALLGGLAAAAAPVLVHIAHRRRSRTMEWGAMRFLVELLTRRRRRMSLDHLLLLAVRVLVIAALALALTRPQLGFRAAGLGDLIPRSGRTAAVIVIDDSMSTAAPRGAPALRMMKKLTHAYLDTLKAGDEVSIVPLSRLAEPVADPIYDLPGAHEFVDRITSMAIASDMPALIEAGLDRLSRHLNPEAELVIVSDGRGEGFSPAAIERWNPVRARLLGAANAPAGSRSRPHVIVLGPRDRHPQGNLSVAAVTVDRTLLPPGRPISIVATMIKDGAQPVSGCLVRLLINGRPVDERALDVPGDQSRDIAFTHAFAEPGSYLIEVVVEGARDALAEDDRRALAVQVEARLPVLLVEGHPGTGLDGTLGLLAAALAPTGDSQRPAVGGVASDLFAITRIGPSDVSDGTLAHARVVVIGDVPALDASAVSALERFVVGGGGIFVVLGPTTDRDLANRFWSRGGDGFLPTGIGALKQTSAHPAASATSHPATAPFLGAAADAWREVAVSHYLALTSAPADLDRILDLDVGDPLLVARARGRGRVALIASTLDGSWNDLPYRGAFVPLARALVGWLGGNILPPRNLLAGERLAWFPGGDAVIGDAAAEGPESQNVPLTRSSWEGHPALLSGPLSRPGAYALRIAGEPAPVWYQVGIAPSESRLAPVTDAQLDAILAGVPRHAVSDPAQVAGLFTIAGDRIYDLWRPLVVASLMLLVCETLLTRLQSARERTSSAVPSERAA